MEEKKEPETRELAEYDEGFVPEYHKRKMSVEIVDAGENPDANQNDAATGGERVVAQIQEAQPVANVEKKYNNRCGPGKIQIMMAGKALKEVLGAIKAIFYSKYGSSEVKFRATENGMTVAQIDPSHVAMVTVEMPKDSFVGYWYDTQAESVDIALDVDRLSKLMTYNKDDVITLEVKTDHDKAEKTLTVDNGSTKASMSVLDEDAVFVPRIPALMPTKDFAVLPPKKFQGALRTAVLISDAARITFDKETLKVGAKSGEESAETVFTKDEMKEFQVNEPGKVLYPIECLQRMVNAIKGTDEFRMTLKEDYPAKIDFYLPVGRGATEKIHITYFLAPRMEP